MLKKLLSVSAAAVLAVSAAMPTVFAERYNFYQEDPAAQYANSTAPISHWLDLDGDTYYTQNGWMTGFVGKGSIGNNTYTWATEDNKPTNVWVDSRAFLPTGKIFRNASPSKVDNLFYRLDTVPNAYISMNNSIGSADGYEDYYLRWIMYVPQGGADDKNTYTYYAYGGARMSLSLKSSTDSSSDAMANDRYEAGVHYKYSDANTYEKCEMMFFDRGNSTWTYGDEIATGKWYNCLLKIHAMKDTSIEKQNATFKMWEYGTDETAAHSISYDFTAPGWENLIVFQPYVYGIEGATTLQAFADFQIDGYTDTDRTDAEAVFAAAEAWNPAIPGEIRTADELNSALSAATAPAAESGVTVTYAINKASDCLTVENNVFSLERPAVWTELALEATFTKGKAVTKKSYPLYIKEKEGIMADASWTRNADGTVKASVTVGNYTNESINPVAIFASYDSSDRLIDVAFENAAEAIAAKGTQSFNKNLTVTGATKVKTYVWDSLDGLNPLTSIPEKAVSEISAAE